MCCCSAFRLPRCPCTGHQTSTRSPRPWHSIVSILIPRDHPAQRIFSWIICGSSVRPLGPQARCAGFPWQGTPAPSQGAQQDRERRIQVLRWWIKESLRVRSRSTSCNTCISRSSEKCCMAGAASPGPDAELGWCPSLGIPFGISALGFCAIWPPVQACSGHFNPTGSLRA